MNQAENFEEVASKKIALVEFFTTWCGPCKMQKKILQDVSEKNKNVFVTSIDIENSPDIADSLKVMMVPTTILFENGKEKGRLNGFHQREKIETLIGSTVAA